MLKKKTCHDSRMFIHVKRPTSLRPELCCHGAAHHRRKLVSVRTLPKLG